MADALASGASVLRDVGVQVPLRAQRAVHEPHGPEVTNSKGFATSGFSYSGGGVVRELTAGELRGEVPNSCSCGSSETFGGFGHELGEGRASSPCSPLLVVTSLAVVGTP